MKKLSFKQSTSKFLLVLIVCFLLPKVYIYAQTKPQAKPISKQITLESDDPCLAYLVNGLSDEYTTVDKQSVFADSKKYFSSDQFRYDYHQGKWNGDISILSPLGFLGLSAGSTDEQINLFQSKIRASSSVQLDEKTYSTMSRSTLRADIANLYNDCILGKTGLSIDAVGEKIVGITITYKTVASRDPMPLIESADIQGVEDADRDRILQSDLHKGRQLGKIAFSAKRKANEELVIVINTQNGAAIVKRYEPLDSDGSGASAPIGTIIASYLDFQTFSELTKNNASNPAQRWNAKYSKWAPCDGRSVDGSKYTLWAKKMVTANPNFALLAPDFRGVFLRGLNQFDNKEEPTTRPDEQANPENKKVGEFQNDALQSHDHNYTLGEWYYNGDNGSKIGYVGVDWKKSNTTKGQSGRVSTETRPKNIAVYYYIRIN